jgi:hypothetical protein
MFDLGKSTAELQSDRTRLTSFKLLEGVFLQCGFSSHLNLIQSPRRLVQNVIPKRRNKLIILHGVITTGCFFSCLADKHEPNASSDALPLLRFPLHIGEV